MAEVLVLVEHSGGSARKVTFELLTAARALGEPSAVVLGAPGTADAIGGKLGEFGAAKVYVGESEDIDAYVVAPQAEVLARLVADRQPAAVLIAASSEGKEVAGRLAVKLESGLLTDVTSLNADGSAGQSIFAGAVLVTSRVRTATPVLALRPNSVTPEPAAGAAIREAVEVSVSDAAKRARVLDRMVEAKGSRPELAEASIVVSGGRGVGSADNFNLIEELADSLGAAVGASRAATDSGFYPHQFQVGQTGKTVSPQLYVACGISGAIQHRAGMQTSKTIVAVNKDPEAPIFELADYGVVGDLFTIVPQATEEIIKRKG